MSTIFNIRSHGAVGNGYADDTHAIQTCLYLAIACDGAVYIPPGTYRVTAPIFEEQIASRISIFGDGKNVSIILCEKCSGLVLHFQQSGAQQPYGVTMRDFAMRALGNSFEAIKVTYGVPPITSDHNQPSVTLDNVDVISDPEGSWANGIILEGAWNPTLNNCFISGNSFGGDWGLMTGAGVSIRGMCVNAHLVNVRCNFWAIGLQVISSDDRNTEGIFVCNCSMVAVKTGLLMKGLAVKDAPRISTITWVGGLIECRVGKQTGQRAAIWLDKVWTVLVSGVQILAEEVPPEDQGPTYAVLAVACNGVVVATCDINAWNYGLHTAGDCRGIAATGCTFTNCDKQVIYPSGTVGSRSYGHTLVTGTPFEWTADPVSNKMGFVN